MKLRRAISAALCLFLAAGTGSVCASERENTENTMLAFLSGSHNAVVGSVLCKTDSDVRISAYEKNGGFYIPLRFAAQSAGFDVEWNGETQTAVISKDGRAAELPADGSVQTEMKFDRIFVTAEKAAELLGMKAELGGNGVAVLFGNAAEKSDADFSALRERMDREPLLFAASSDLSASVEKAEELVRGYTLAEWLECVPAQSGRSRVPSVATPDIHTINWEWDSKNPNVIRDPESGVTFPDSS